MKRFRRVPTLLVWSILFAGLGSPARGQVPGSGTVFVTVSDTRGGTVTGAVTRVEHAGTGWAGQSLTDGGGRAHVAAIPVGIYALAVERIGYQPARVENVSVRSGREARVTVVLLPVTDAPSDVAVDTAGPGTLTQARPGESRWVERGVVSYLPSSARTARDLLSTLTASADLSQDGLPADLSAFSLDGVRWRPLPRARSERVLSGQALTLDQDAAFDIVTNGADAHWGGAAGTWFAVHAPPGSARTGLQLRVSWAGDPLSASSVADGVHEEIHGAVVLDGTASSGRGRYSIGAALRRADEPLSAAWRGGSAADAITTAAAARDVDLAALTRTTLAHSEAMSVRGAGELRVNDNHEITLSLRAASIARETALDTETGFASGREGNDFAAQFALRSRVMDGLFNLLRVSATRSERQRDTTQLPLTMFAETGTFAGSSERWDSWSEAVATIGSTVSGRGLRHEVSAGVELSRTQYEFDSADGLVRSFAFGGPAELADGTGATVETQYPGGTASWSSIGYAAFVQDRWNIARGLSLQLGVRLDGAMLPSGIDRDEEWFRLTGIANDGVSSVTPLVSPRVAATWNVNEKGTWLLHAAAGMHADRLDPAILADWYADQGAAVVTRTTGAVAWPAASSGDVSATRLTLLARDYALPRSGRISLGAARRIDARTTAAISGMVRRTERLARRFDLNLLPLPVAFDQHGRGVFGTLIQQGALLTAAPGSNRRFDSYDEVTAITADGWSDHWALSATFDRQVTAGTSVFAHYTFSRTTDNWVGAASRTGSTIVPTALPGTTAWDEGRSDFDRPHRLAAGAVVGAGPLTLSGTYRVESGVPFTPGYRVDVNADGVIGNDPAFVDEAIAGTDALLREWPCLREASGGIAERNSCRTAAAHALDLSGRVTVAAGARLRASVIVDAIDLLDSWHNRPDAALYLVDPSATLVVDEEARTVALPLVANTGFGSESVTRRPGRRLRIGLSLNW